MNSSKKINWCWANGEHVLSIKGIGSSIQDAYQRLNKNDKAIAIKNVKWIEINGVRQ